jgi:hypothetical protein
LISADFSEFLVVNGRRDALTQFRISISAACQQFRMSHRVFCRRTGLPGFEIETDFEKTPPKQIVASALEQLCPRDRSDFDKILCMAMVDFLDEMLGPPRDDPEKMTRLRALAEIIIHPGLRHEYLKWADSYYD